MNLKPFHNVLVGNQCGGVQVVEQVQQDFNPDNRKHQSF